MKEQSYGQKKIDGSNILILDSNFCFQMSSNINPLDLGGGLTSWKNMHRSTSFFKCKKSDKTIKKVKTKNHLFFLKSLLYKLIFLLARSILPFWLYRHFK